MKYILFFYIICSVVLYAFTYAQEEQQPSSNELTTKFDNQVISISLPFKPENVKINQQPGSWLLVESQSGPVMYYIAGIFVPPRTPEEEELNDILPPPFGFPLMLWVDMAIDRWQEDEKKGDKPFDQWLLEQANAFDVALSESPPQWNLADWFDPLDKSAKPIPPFTNENILLLHSWEDDPNFQGIYTTQNYQIAIRTLMINNHLYFVAALIPNGENANAEIEKADAALATFQANAIEAPLIQTLPRK